MHAPSRPVEFESTPECLKLSRGFGSGREVCREVTGEDRRNGRRRLASVIKKRGEPSGSRIDRGGRRRGFEGGGG